MQAINTAILNNRFTAMVEEAAEILKRTAHTSFVKLVQDYQCALATPEGEVFAHPSLSGVMTFIGLSLRSALARLEVGELRDGDVIITNDPFSTDGLTTHMMDITMIRPIFVDGKLIAYAWSFIHASDIGGAVPGSVAPGSIETFQEGVRVRPIKLFDAGQLNVIARNIFTDNSRIPDELWGDLQAMIAALNSLDLRLKELCTRVPVEEVSEGMNACIAYTESKARAIIETIPDGEYVFSEFLEGLSDDDLGYIRVTMRVKGSSVELDFTGTDPQVASSYNFIIGEDTHPYVTLALTNYILTIDPLIPKNGGLQRPIRTVAPRGTIVNADYPAAMGARVASGGRVYDAVLGCLNLAIPEGVIASGSGMAGLIMVAGRDVRTGKRRVSMVNPVSGGGGARRGVDGIEGVDGRFGGLQTVPVEVIEAELPIKVRAFKMLENSKAAGQWVSGAAILLELEATDNDVVMTAQGLNRFLFRPWGAKGGAPGALGRAKLSVQGGDFLDIGRLDVLRLNRGDVVRFETPAGGGFGDAWQRDTAAVQDDIDAGLIDAKRAVEQFGVVVGTDGVIDAAATQRLRDTRGATSSQAIVQGPERLAYDAIWPDAVRARFAFEVLARPPAVRRELLGRVREQLNAQAETVTVQALVKALASDEQEYLR